VGILMPARRWTLSGNHANPEFGLSSHFFYYTTGLGKGNCLEQAAHAEHKS